ncbi:barstar family protein [uncultured Friedmanniella sp.]|uniref:barstar family protein n=1 Tax=uncultured Friedmanniella sp. TaxID=335381 RepID=UPI0035CC7587
MAGEEPGADGLTWLEPDQLGEALALWRAEHPEGTVLELRGERAADRSAFFDEAATAWSLPSWFGRNWDALYDALNDLSWLDRPACLLVVHRADRLLRDSPEQREVLLRVLADASRRWADNPGPGTFTTLLVTDGDTAGG